MDCNLGGLKTIRRKHVISILICVYLILPLFVEVSSVTIWSDDFNDENLDGWTTIGFNRTSVPPEESPANYSIDEHNLRITGENQTQAYHPSTVGTGTWSFDLDCVDTPRHHFHIMFMGSNIMNVSNMPGSIPREYGLLIFTGPYGAFDDEFVLYRRDAGSADISQVIDRYSVQGLSGWANITISRNSIGFFQIFINGTQCLTGSDTVFETSEYFAIFSEPGPAIDNIVVTDEPLPDPPSTETTPTTPTTTTGATPDMTGIYLVVGGVAVVIVIVIVVLMKKRS